MSNDQLQHLDLDLSTFELDQLMAFRYAYYCKTESLISDRLYDELEDRYTLIHGELPVGSSNEESYTPAQQALYLYFIMSTTLFRAKHAERTAMKDLI